MLGRSTCHINDKADMRCQNIPADILQKLVPEPGNALRRVQILLASAHWDMQSEIWSIVVGVSMGRQLIFEFLICKHACIFTYCPVLVPDETLASETRTAGFTDTV